MKLLATFLLALCLGFSAYAQPKPGTTITVYSGLKTSAQLLQFMDILKAEMPDYNFTFEEKPGAGGIVAGNFFATAPGNGTKLLLFGAMGTLVYHDVLFPDIVKYERSDIKTLSSLYENKEVLVTHIDNNVKTMDDFKRKLTDGTSQINIGVRTTTDKIVCTNLLKLIQSTRMECIDYPNSFKLQHEVLGNQIEFGLINYSEALAQDKLRIVGSLKTYNASMKSMYTTFPELKKTYAGLAALALPGSAPPEVVEFWEKALLKVIASDKYKEFIEKNMLHLDSSMIGSKNFENLIFEARKNR